MRSSPKARQQVLAAQGETPSSIAAAIASGTIMFDEAVLEHASVKKTVKTTNAAVRPQSDEMPVTRRNH